MRRPEVVFVLGALFEALHVGVGDGIDQMHLASTQRGQADRILSLRCADDLVEIGQVAQFIGLCSSLKWSRHRTKSPFLALPAMAGSNAAYKIISACSNAVSC